MSKITKNYILKNVKKYIEAMNLEFQKNPFNFRSEEDIQSFLYSKLLKKFPQEYETQIYSGKKLIKIRIFHPEYGIGKSERIDFGIITQDQINEINGFNSIKGAKKTNGIVINPFIGFEFKSDTTEISKLSKEIEKDCKKLNRSKAEYQYFICYFKDIVKSNIRNHLGYFKDLKLNIKRLKIKFPKINFRIYIYYHLNGKIEEIN